NFVWVPAGARAAGLDGLRTAGGVGARAFAGEGVRISSGSGEDVDRVAAALTARAVEGVRA
ncbi:histidinol-phosphate transaminase, partial [Microbacterium resistens]|nr:histidinol-phosphate transaminase [Microbacterium resistens]